MICDHEQLDFGIQPRAFKDTNLRCIRMSVRCRDCGQAFRFVGLTSHRDIERPAVNSEDTVAYLPVIEQYEEVSIHQGAVQ